ncbi:ABC transporter ATP-binding protein [Streptomyces sp. NPDC051658]|uniref:ABC transporter ATP-binding protein n=1 Tax=Streptomyces sp. NPDC051658 TaxID=3365667 RepID=UPI0037A5FBE8
MKWLDQRVKATRILFLLAWRADPQRLLLLTVVLAANSAILAINGLSQRWLVDSAGVGDLQALLMAGILGGVALSLYVALNVMQLHLGYQLGDRIDLLLNREVLGRCMSAPRVDHLEYPEYLNRIETLRRETRSLADFVPCLGGVISAAVSVGSAGALLSQIHWSLALLPLFSIPPLVADLRARSVVAQAKISASTDLRREEMLHGLCTQFGTAKEIIIAGAGGYVAGEAAESWTKHAKAISAAQMRTALGKFLGWTFFIFGYLASIAIVARRVMASQATLGELVLTISMGVQLRFQMRVAVDSLGRLGDGALTVEQLLWLREFQSIPAMNARDHSQTLPDSGNGIEIKELDFTYPGAAKPSLRNISLSIPQGSVIALVGVNGSGKTTLTNLLTGMYSPTSGTISINGQRLELNVLSAWRERIAGTFQEYVKFETSAREAIGAGDRSHKVDEQVIARAAERAGAGGFIEKFPQGLDTQLGSVLRGHEPSEGQWQRIALARGMVREEPIALFFDEPTAAIDPVAELDIFDRLVRYSRIQKACATLLISHRMATARMADEIIVLNAGEIAERGSHEELMDLHGIYFGLFSQQSSAYL